jgi:hypothetical protein
LGESDDVRSQEQQHPEAEIRDDKTSIHLEKGFTRPGYWTHGQEPQRAMVCMPTPLPKSIKKAWYKLYGEQCGYKQMHIKKFTPTVKRTEESVLSETQVARNRKGTEYDVVKYWEHIYKKKQWNRYATFDKNPNKLFNKPYLLFKSKNITDKQVRQEKWFKARPIAPQTKHPMRRMFHITGRAWAFLTANLPGEHFVIQHGGKLPEFFGKVQEKLENQGPIKCVVKDIEGCFPNMPKDAIRFGLRDLISKIKKETGHTGVVVSNKDSHPCMWKTKRKIGIKHIPFEVMMDVMEFALDNTLIKDLDGNLWRQEVGIPMGDPHSPGMTIGACAWMEHEWMQTLDIETKAMFKAVRYMDDILMFHVEKPNFDQAKFLSSFCKSDCYWNPLKLEDGKSDTFLESTFEVTKDNKIRYWLKNENEIGQEPKTWRYAHFHSYATFESKKGVMIATLKKLDKMASDDNALINSAIKKLHEFIILKYPAKLIWTACTSLAITTRNTAWFKIRGIILKQTNSYRKGR